jgi:hypothetical protein
VLLGEKLIILFGTGPDVAANAEKLGLDSPLLKTPKAHCP